MFQAIRKHLTPSTFIAFMALIFAMTGGAFAASSHGGGSGSKPTALVGANTTVATTAKSKAKPKTKAGARGPAGPAGKNGTNGTNGAQGATGPAGPAGPTGPAGGPGIAGTNGSNGTSVTGVAIPTSEKAKCGGQGGTAYTSASGTENVCNGTTGFTETLPVGKTETGEWSLSVPAENPTLKTSLPVSSISFVIPLTAAPVAHYLKKGEQETAECPGTAAEPEAAEGQLCVYAELEVNAPGSLTADAATFGAKIVSDGGEPGGVAFGTWAVTAE